MAKETLISAAAGATSSDYLMQPARSEPYALFLWGNFDGATGTVKFSSDGTTTSTSLATAKDPFSGEACAPPAPDVVMVPGGVPVFISLSATGSGTIYGKLV